MIGRLVGSARLSGNGPLFRETRLSVTVSRQRGNGPFKVSERVDTPPSWGWSAFAAAVWQIGPAHAGA